MQAPPLEAILGLSGRLIWLSLLHATWLGLLAAATVAIAFQARPRLSHRARHDTSLVVLIVVAVGAPAIGIAQHAAGPAWGNEPDEAAVSVAIARGEGETDRTPPAAPANVSNTETTSQPFLRGAMSALLRSAVAATSRSRTVVLAAWSFGFLGLACVLVMATTAARQLRRASIPAESLVQASATRLCRLLRLGHAPEIRVHSTLAEPCLCGVVRPIVLLPGGWLAKAGPEAIDAVLAHELAHARRADYLVNLLQRLIETWLFYHPAVHWLSRSLRRHREFCTDALSVRLTGNPLALARALESVALHRPARPTRPGTGASLGGDSSSLYPRIQELLGMTPIRPRSRNWPFVAFPSAAALAVLSVSVGAAQDDSPRVGPSPQPPADAARLHGGGPSPSAPLAISDMQINYEVRVFDVDADTWRVCDKSPLKAAGEGRGSQGWVVDSEGLVGILKPLVGDSWVQTLQYPKVTSFNGARATFLSGPRRDERLDVTGSVTLGGFHLSVEIVSPLSHRIGIEEKGGEQVPGASTDPRDVRGEAPPGAGRTDNGSGANQATPDIRARYKASEAVPAGSSFLVCLGDFTRNMRGAKIASKRLVLITPRRILVEVEPGQAIGSPPRR